MCKYWNKAASPLKLSLPAFADSFSLLELFRLPVGNKSLIDNKILHKKGFTFWTFFFADEACFHLSGYINSQYNSVCTAWKSPEFANCLEKICGTIVLWRDNYCRKLSRSF